MSTKSKKKENNNNGIQRIPKLLCTPATKPITKKMRPARTSHWQVLFYRSNNHEHPPRPRLKPGWAACAPTPLANRSKLRCPSQLHRALATQCTFYHLAAEKSLLAQTLQEISESMLTRPACGGANEETDKLPIADTRDDSRTQK
jgi:hypothetical protein